MSIGWTIMLFFACLALSVVSSFVLVDGLDRVSARWHFSPGLVGLVTLSADSPEISSAVSALAGGHSDLGASVVYGSNVFNLGAMLGLSAALAGHVSAARRDLASGHLDWGPRRPSPSRRNQPDSGLCRLRRTRVCL